MTCARPFCHGVVTRGRYNVPRKYCSAECSAAAQREQVREYWRTMSPAQRSKYKGTK